MDESAQNITKIKSDCLAVRGRDKPNALREVLGQVQ